MLDRSSGEADWDSGSEKGALGLMLVRNAKEHTTEIQGLWSVNQGALVVLDRSSCGADWASGSEKGASGLTWKHR